MLQNAHKELWALLSWANPGSLSDWTSFERHYVNPLKYGQKKDCTDIQLAKVGISYCDCCVAGEAIAMLILLALGNAPDISMLS